MDEDTEGFLDIFGGSTPLAIIGEVFLEAPDLEIVALFVAEPLSFTDESLLTTVLGTDRAFTSSRFSTTYPISGPARYLIFLVQICVCKNSKR